MKPLFAFGLFALCSSPFNLTLASQNAVIVTDGAIVYKKADFDAPIIGYFRAGEKTRISNKTFGPFYRVRFKQGLVGYVADIDVNPQGGGGGRPGKPGAKNKTSKDKPADFAPATSTIAKSYVGATVAYVNWSELFKSASISQQFSDNLIFYGAKGTFPFGRWLGGPFTLDTNLLFSFKTPSFLNTPPLSTTGFIVIGDAGILYTLGEFEHRKIPVYFGGGLLLTYENYSITGTNPALPNVSQITLGASVTAGAGYAFRNQNMIMRAEAKYFISQATFIGVLVSLQWKL